MRSRYRSTRANFVMTSSSSSSWRGHKSTDLQSVLVGRLSMWVGPINIQWRTAGGPLMLCLPSSVRTFFETASRMPWYKNTLFVFTAGHDSAEIQYQEYNSAGGIFPFRYSSTNPVRIGPPSNRR